jgi:hypothetical protein
LDVSGQIHAPVALPPEKEPPEVELDPSVVQPIASLYTDNAIKAHNLTIS